MSKGAEDLLHALGVRVAMITGDSQAVADSVARRLGLRRWYESCSCCVSDAYRRSNAERAAKTEARGPFC